MSNISSISLTVTKCRESSHRRLVLEFRRDPNSEFVALKLDNIPLLPDMKKWIQASSSRVDDLTCRVGHYECSIRRSGIPFDEYLNINGFHIVSVSAEDQLSYGCNCLNLGNSHIVCVNNKTARDIAKTTQMKGLIEYLDFSAITVCSLKKLLAVVIMYDEIFLVSAFELTNLCNI